MTSGVNVARPAMLDCPMHTYKSKEDGTFSFTFPAKANKIAGGEKTVNK